MASSLFVLQFCVVLKTSWRCNFEAATSTQGTFSVRFPQPCSGCGAPCPLGPQLPLLVPQISLQLRLRSPSCRLPRQPVLDGRVLGEVAGLSPSLLCSPCKEVSVSGHVSIVLQVSLSQFFLFPLLGAVEPFLSQHVFAHVCSSLWFVD